MKQNNTLSIQKPSFVVVTPCKNEERNLPVVIKGLMSQTEHPALWIIVNDGSTDNSQSIIDKAKKEISWLISIETPYKKRDRGLHLSSVIKEGFDFAVEYCLNHNIEYDFIANIDSDILLEDSYFEKLTQKFIDNSMLGIASGGIYHHINDELIRENLSDSEPSGACLLIRNECYEEIEGIPISYSWESVLATKAKISGWETKLFNDIVANELRDTDSAEGYWKGFLFRGKSAYYLNFNPLHVILKSILYIKRKSAIAGMAYMYGYVGSIITRKEKINDEKVKYYFMHIRPKELIKSYIKK
jgi:glycosyltransferase involved in cell wall biosynthesis